MALPFDVPGAFDSPECADVTLKLDGREIKCHKLILCQSDYFKTLCGPGSRFKERDEAVIELKDDDGAAVEIMLRYMYNFPNENILERMRENNTKWLQMSVFVVAKNYLMSQLAAIALEEVRSKFKSVTSAYERTNDAYDILAILQYLNEYKEHDAELSTTMADLTKEYCRNLFAHSEFRKILEVPENKDALKMAVAAVTCHPSKADLEVDACLQCGNRWFHMEGPARCMYCSNPDSMLLFNTRYKQI